MLRGDASKSHDELDWSPTVNFREVICEIVDSDIGYVRREVNSVSVHAWV